MFPVSILPNITGPSPCDLNKKIEFIFSKAYIDKLNGASRAQKLFEAWGLIVGEKPPINNIGRHEEYLPDNDLMTLSDAIAVFRGLKRPQGSEENGWRTFIYVLNPIFVYDRISDMVCMAKKVIVPHDWVFVVYVIQQPPLEGGNDPARWTIIGWEFVLSDGGQPKLPADWEERYIRETWRK